MKIPRFMAILVMFVCYNSTYIKRVIKYRHTCNLFYLKKLNQQLYCDDRNIAPDQKIFSVGERQVQKYLKKVVDYLGYEEPIGSHSFRKYFATEIYKQNNYDIVLVQKLL